MLRITKFVQQPPEIVYQSQRSVSGAGVDGSSPLILTVDLSDESAAVLKEASTDAAALVAQVHIDIRRFDGCVCEMYHTPSKTMRKVQLSPAMFLLTFKDDPSQLVIHARRKYLPLSVNLGKAPLMFVMVIKATLDYVTSTPFIVASKQNSRPKLARTPKRLRVPSTMLPLLKEDSEDYSDEDAMFINTILMA
jgi:hypothetical protein